MEGKLICHGIRCSRISARLFRHCLPTIHDLLCIGHLHVTYKDELIRCGPRRSVESIVLRTNEYRAEILLGWSDKRETCLDICLARANETSYVFSSFSARCINKQNEQRKVETKPGLQQILLVKLNKSFGFNFMLGVPLISFSIFNPFLRIF